MLITSVALLTRTNYGTLATAGTGTPSAFLLFPSDLALFFKFLLPTSALGSRYQPRIRSKIP
jgi:hypothetical protein